jgi:FimV-like protein
LTSLDLPKVEETRIERPDSGNTLEFNLEDFKLDQPTLTATSKAPPAAVAAHEAPLEFDLSSFDLDSVEPAAGSEAQLPNVDGIRLDDFDLGMPDDSHAISTGDEASTKLDLARAYVDMGDNDMARSLLNEVLQQGSDTQKGEAQTLLGRLA